MQYLKGIADTPDGLDLPLGMGHGIQLGPQPFDVGIDGAGITIIVGAPEAVQQVVPGKYPALVREQQAEDVELLARERYRLARDERP